MSISNDIKPFVIYDESKELAKRDLCGEVKLFFRNMFSFLNKDLEKSEKFKELKREEILEKIDVCYTQDTEKIPSLINKLDKIKRKDPKFFKEIFDGEDAKKILKTVYLQMKSWETPNSEYFFEFVDNNFPNLILDNN